MSGLSMGCALVISLQSAVHLWRYRGTNQQIVIAGNQGMLFASAAIFVLQVIEVVLL